MVLKLKRLKDRKALMMGRIERMRIKINQIVFQSEPIFDGLYFDMNVLHEVNRSIGRLIVSIAEGKHGTGRRYK